MRVSQSWLDNYLSFLEVDRQAPDLEYLRRLSHAHLARVPFENITSILRRASAGEARVPALDREAELDAWRQRRGGGVCFEVVEMFGALLDGLGFRSHPVLATISFAGSHQAVLVELDGTRYLVDTGNGAPFFEPIPIGRETEIGHVGLSYRFRPDGDSRDAWIQDRLIEGAWQPFCTYDLSPAETSLREVAYQRHHVIGETWVVDNLTMVRCMRNEVWSLRDNRLTHYTTAGRTVSTLDSIAAYREAAAQIFDLPAAPIDQALEVLKQRRG